LRYYCKPGRQPDWSHGNCCGIAEQQKNSQDNSLFFARPTVAGLAETAADTENGYRYTDPRCCLLFRGPGID
jgi:hypothetical protein